MQMDDAFEVARSAGVRETWRRVYSEVREAGLKEKVEVGRHQPDSTIRSPGQIEKYFVR
jgi:hypothetical protein